MNFLPCRSDIMCIRKAALSVPLSVKLSIFGLDMKIRRGDILYVDMGGQYEGSMQGGMRPVIVVSNNMANKHSTVITVVPLSTKINKKRSGYLISITDYK